jgi:hypothetical protein
VFRLRNIVGAVCHVRRVPNTTSNAQVAAKDRPQPSLRWAVSATLPRVVRRDLFPYCRLRPYGVTPGLGFPPITLFLYVILVPPPDVVSPVAFQAIVESLNDT